MITNTIAGPQFEALIAELGVEPHRIYESEAVKKLVALIDSHTLKSERRAVEEYKAVCKFQGLVACNEKNLDAVMHGAGIPRKLQLQFEGVKTSEFDTNLKVPDDLTPHFTVEESPELNALLNDTAALLDHGNMDVGIGWADSLDAVLALLRKPQSWADDPTERGMLLHRLACAARGHASILAQWIGSDKTLEECGYPRVECYVLFDRIGDEFQIDFTVDDRHRYFGLTFQQVADELTRKLWH